jgi:hypothetical protein
MSLEVNSGRRRFLHTSAMALVASDLAMIKSAKAEVFINIHTHFTDDIGRVASDRVGRAR